MSGTPTRGWVRASRWPDPDDPRRFRIGCSCFGGHGWKFEGTVAEINTASRDHDDSPGNKHVVSIREVEQWTA